MLELGGLGSRKDGSCVGINGEILEFGTGELLYIYIHILKRKFDIEEVSKLFRFFIGRDQVHTLKEGSSADYAKKIRYRRYEKTMDASKINTTQIGAMVLLKYPHPFPLEIRRFFTHGPHVLFFHWPFQEPKLEVPTIYTVRPI